MGKYTVKSVQLKTVKYEVMIYQLPVGELDDKLTYFTRERGLIPKSLYDDFLIATCIANVGPLLQHLQQKGTDLKQLSVIRQELVSNVVEVNPKLSPDNLVINKNHVVKLKNGKDAGFIDLKENEFWERDVYQDGTVLNEMHKNRGKLDSDVIKNIGELPYDVIQKFWRRINQYISIKQFEPGSELTILANRTFSSRLSFEQYVVTMCIEEIEDLFLVLDKMGLPNRMDHYTIIHELYSICREVNPFLDYEACDSIIDNSDEGVVDPFESFQKAGANESDDSVQGAVTNTKMFRDVPTKIILELSDKMKKKVIGQESALEDLSAAIQRASVGLKDPEQPIGSFIFTGYTGVGKTYTAKILAEELVGSRRNLITIDCSEYTADHEYAKLIGAPSGYIGHEQGGYLTNAIKKNPFSIVLFDEIEKASEKVHQLMLQVMDEARLTDGKGNRVSFRDAIIVMTSNLGVKETQKVGKSIGFGNVADITPEKQKKAVTEALKKKFKPEFLNRITCMINFNALSKKDYLKIIKLELNKLKC